MPREALNNRHGSKECPPPPWGGWGAAFLQNARTQVARRFLRLTALALALLASPAMGGEIPEQRANELEHLVIQDCGSCHGMTMKGGLGSPLTRDAIGHYDPETLSEVILDGVPGTAMPPWRPLLSKPEAMWVARYLLEEPKP